MDTLPYINDTKQFVPGVVSTTRSLTLGMDPLPSQMSTIEEARAQGIDLPHAGLERMNTVTLQTMSEADRTAWYRAKLAPYLNQVNLSAARHRLPPELVGAIVLNELGDIGVEDQVQDALMIDGSIGFAQIQVKTAIEHGLIAQEGDQKWITDHGQAKYDAQFLDPGLPNTMPIKTLDACCGEAEKELTFKRLLVPQYAIEAAARELKLLIGKMTKRRANVWQRLVDFSLASLDDVRNGEDLYLYVKGKTDKDRACNLSRLCSAAYNSPEIIDAEREESITPGSPGFHYKKAVPHGNNAWELMRDLYALQPTKNGVLLYSGWVGRVAVNGNITRYSQAAVPIGEYNASYEGSPLITGLGLVRVTASARAFSKEALINNFLYDFYKFYNEDNEEIGDDMIPPLAPVTVRIFSETLCRLLDGYSDATKDVYGNVLADISENYQVDWSDYLPLPANLMLVEGTGSVSIQLDGAAIASRIAQVKATNPEASIDEDIDIRVVWYLDATELLGEDCQMRIEDTNATFLLRVNQ